MAARRPLIHTNGDLKELPDADHADLSIGAAFTPVASPAYQEGYVFYDTDKKALSYYNEEADVIVNMGQETLVRVRNTTGVTITNGEAVYINGSQGANLPTVALAQANTLAPSRAIGIATHDIENNSNGYITSLGTVGDLNTSAFAAGDALYLSSTTPGALTNTKPTTGYIVLLGYCTISHVTAGEIKVIPKQAGLDLLDLQDFNKDSYSGIGGTFMFIDPNETYADVIPNTELYWDVTNNRLSLMTGVSPQYTFHMTGEQAVVDWVTDPASSVYASTHSAKATLTAASTRTVVGSYNTSEIVHGGFNSTGSIFGSLNYSFVSGAGTLTAAVASSNAVIANVGATGTITKASANSNAFVSSEATNTVTDLKIVESAIAANAGTITNTYAFYVGDITAGTQTNTPFGVYVSDAGAHNYFAGNTGFGTSTPAYQLESNAEIGLGERASDPANPAEGKTVIWQSNGVGTGADGELYLKTTAGAVTKTIQLTDFANGTVVGTGGPQNKYDATAAPVVGDDDLDGYSVGSIWIDVTNDNSYICMDATTGAAVWEQINGAGGGGTPTLEDFPVGYVELGTLDYGATASNSDTFDVTGYEEVLIEHQKCTHGAGEWEVNLSDDGGATYHATSGDYKRGALYGSGGESDTSATGFRMSVNAGSNLHGITTIHNLGSTSGRVWAYSVGSKMAGTYGVGWQYFNTTGGPFTHIRIRNASSNNSTAGTVKIWGKIAPVAPQVQPTEITATTYSTVNTDFGGNIIRRVNHATGCTVTVEPSMTSKQPLTFIQTGAGQITFAAGTGVTINSADGDLKTRVQYSSAQLIPDLDTANTYYLIGDITT